MKTFTLKLITFVNLRFQVKKTNLYTMKNTVKRFPNINDNKRNFIFAKDCLMMIEDDIAF